MAVLTLPQAKQRINDEIARGIVDTIIDVNPWFSFIPYTGFAGQSITVNPVDSYGNVEAIGVGDAITADSPTTYLQKTFYPTTITGKVEMNGLVQTTSLGAGVDELQAQLMKKSEKLAHKFQEYTATGTGTLPQTESLRSLSAASQSKDAGGAAVSFALLDELRDNVRSKGMTLDAFVMPRVAVRKVRDLLRSAGGTRPMDINGMMVETFDGVPIFTNDYLDVNEGVDGTTDTPADVYSIYACNFDDGTRATGVSAIYPEAAPNFGFQLKPVGQSDSYDAESYIMTNYVGFANFSDLGLARLYNIAK